MKIILSILLLIVCFLSSAQEEIVYIPDTNWKAWLIARDFVNTNGDDEIQISEAVAYTSNISAFSASEGAVTDVTGLEEFINIDGINFSWHDIQTINLTNNPLIIIIMMDNNLITNLNLENNIWVRDLSLTANNLTEIDLSNNPELESIHLEYNNLTQVNLANGNNSHINLIGLIGNPDLTCVQVDPGFVVPQPGDGTGGWWYDDYSVFSEDCYENMAVNEPETAEKIKLYPNPVKDVLNIQSAYPIKEIGIYDIQGKLIQTASNTNKISLASLPKAMYLVQVETEKGRFTEKVLKD